MKKKQGSGKESDSLVPDAALWRLVAETVTPYKARPRPRPPVREEKKVAAAQPVKKPPAPPAKKTAAPPVVKPPPSRGMDAATARRMKRGQMEVEARLDLHGLTQAEARAALERFLNGAARRGLRNVLVITGKGKLPDAGVLRRRLPEWLAADFASLALACTPARPRDGGDGAFYVRLRSARA